MAAIAEPSNAPEWTVSELAGALRRTLEDRFGLVRLRGEISGYRGPHASGHAYFCLKDREARVDAVVWKTALVRMRFRPQEGLEVVATGRITTFPGKSTYQIVIEQLEPAGAGALMALLDERRRRLAAEGLFAEARKRAVPFLPRVVGIVTSPTGSVIRDILHRLRDRFPRHVLVWPVRVQGESCAAEVAAAIAGLNALPPSGRTPRPDVIIVARGGGSLEDLWGFNEEIVVRAAVASSVPLIAAIGHETDWTLIDHAADLRAPTPTGAAEMAVPVRAELLARVGGLRQRHEDAARRVLETRRFELRSAARALPALDAVFAAPRQRLDVLSARLAPALLVNAREHERLLRALSVTLARYRPDIRLAAYRENLRSLAPRSADALGRSLGDRRRDLAQVGRRLRAARDASLRAERVRLGSCRERVAGLAGLARRAALASVERSARRLDQAGSLLANLGYRAVLARGYALVRGIDDRPIFQADSLTAGQTVQIEFGDGLRRANVEGARVRRRVVPLVQTSLFDN